MKKILLVIVAFLYVTTGAEAQVPNQFAYQAVLRDANRQVLSNVETTVTISIIKGAFNGDVVFTEDHNVTTTAEGVINLNIGSVNTTGIQNIDWGFGVYYISINVNGVEMGSKQLLSVPYALYAGSVGNDNDSNYLSSFENFYNSILASMADMSVQIGEMSDRILDMADKIGEMADRIVHTEEMMFNTSTEMANISKDVAFLVNNSGSNSDGESSVFIKKVGVFNPPLVYGKAPDFSISNPTDEYLVYVSSSLSMDSNTISVLVNNHMDFSTQWPKLQELAKNGKIYIAVKTISGNNISSLSNVLTYTTMY